jgi:hypothetical protein
MEGFGGQRDRADEASSELLRWGLIGRIGMGRGWEAMQDTFYVLKDSVSHSYSPIRSSEKVLTEHAETRRPMTHLLLSRLYEIISMP